MTAQKTYLVINAGSSSIKYALYDAKDLSQLEKKTVEIKGGDYDTAFGDILSLIGEKNVVGIAHRVVHGGRDYAAPQRINAQVLSDLEALTPLAPLHQPHNTKPIALVMQKYPDLPQVACFDTAFHRTQPKRSEIYALPRALTDEGILRYGFHGSSYEYIASVLPDVAGDAAKGKFVVAHLGNGSSMCAMENGKSIATTMGFTPLDGLMMGTRTGAIDPGVVLHLIEQKGLSAKEISDIFNKQSGLKGVSGISGDMRELLASKDPKAAEAVDLFCLYAARNIAALSVDMGGLDGIVFTAGIGENSAVIRKKICANLAHMGVFVDTATNDANASSIHAENSAVKIFVIKTNEEKMMARHIAAAVNADSPSAKIPAARR